MSDQRTQNEFKLNLSPSKRIVDDTGESDRLAKRRRTGSVQSTAAEKELAPRFPSSDEGFNATPVFQRSSIAPGVQRLAVLNLKNYPSNHHPVGIGVWVVQKVDQARRDCEQQVAKRYRSYTNGVMAAPSQAPDGGFNSVQLPVQSSFHWANPIYSGYVRFHQADEQEAERLQAQRNRKTKQRSENWAKNKETDVVARAKLEAKKKFEPEVSDADMQIWIEEKIKSDFGRLLDRLAAQLNSEIVHLPPYQLGFADYYFTDTNHDDGDLDDQTTQAGRLLAGVLPALAEGQVSSNSQKAADSLIQALESNNPPVQAFHVAIYKLAQNCEMLVGIDRVLGYLSAPKTGPQLARKRASVPSDQLSLPNLGASSHSTMPQNAPVWHWKEPVTLANSTRYSNPPSKAASTKKMEIGHASAQAAPQHSVTQASALVQAEIFRPPQPSLSYFPYSYKEKEPHTFDQYITAKSYSPPNEIRSKEQQTTFITLSPIDIEANPNMWSQVSPNSSPSQSGNDGLISGSLNGNSALNEEVPAPTRSASSSSAVSDKADAGSELAQARTGSATTPTNPPANSAKVAVAIPEPTDTVVARASRRRSSRDRVPTTKALAAGILLGPSRDQVDQTASFDNSAIGFRSPKASSEMTPKSPIFGRRSSSKANSPSQTTQLTPSVEKGKDLSPDILPLAEEVVPRSSGRDRKPTAKVLEAKVRRGSRKRSVSPIFDRPTSKIAKISKSAPKISSKLKLSACSPEYGTPSPGSTTQARSIDLNASTAEEGPISEGLNGAIVSSDEDTRQVRPESIIQPLPEAMPYNGAVFDAGNLNVSSTDLSLPVGSAVDKMSRNGSVFHQAAAIEFKIAPPIMNMADGKSTQHEHRSTPSNNVSPECQALLLMSLVAAEWPDSDDDDYSEKEHIFQAKLARAKLRTTNSKLEGSLVQIPPQGGDVCAASELIQEGALVQEPTVTASQQSPLRQVVHASAIEDPTKASASATTLQQVSLSTVNCAMETRRSHEAYDILRQLSHDEPELAHDQTAGTKAARSQLAPDAAHGSTNGITTTTQPGSKLNSISPQFPTLLSSNGTLSSTAAPVHSNSASTQHLANGSLGKAAAVRSNSLSTDDWIVRVRVKDEARARGLTIDDPTTTDDIRNMIKEHDTAALNNRSKHSLGAQAPSRRRPVAIPPPQHHAPFLTGNQPGWPRFVPEAQMSPARMQFYFTRNLPRQVPPSSGVTISAQETLQSISRSLVDHQQPGSADVNSSSNGWQSTLREPLVLGAKPREGKLTAQHTSRHDLIPQGLNGGPPGGGTIINGLETREAHAKMRQKSKGPDWLVAVNGDINSIRNSIGPIQRNGSLTPQPQNGQTPKFKKGGQLIHFGRP